MFAIKRATRHSHEKYRRWWRLGQRRLALSAARGEASMVVLVGHLTEGLGGVTTRKTDDGGACERRCLHEGIPDVVLPC